MDPGTLFSPPGHADLSYSPLRSGAVYHSLSLSLRSFLPHSECSSAFRRAEVLSDLLSLLAELSALITDHWWSQEGDEVSSPISILQRPHPPLFVLSLTTAPYTYSLPCLSRPPPTLPCATPPPPIPPPPTSTASPDITNGLITMSAAVSRNGDQYDRERGFVPSFTAGSCPPLPDDRPAVCSLSPSVSFEHYKLSRATQEPDLDFRW